MLFIFMMVDFGWFDGDEVVGPGDLPPIVAIKASVIGLPSIFF